MKILLHGPSVKVEWWHNKVAKCDYCGTEVQLEKGDKVDDLRQYRPNNKRWAQIKCPVCPEKIVLDYADTVQRPPPPPAPPKTRYLTHP